VAGRPYLSERQWGTVREDYSKDGDAWNYFSHDHARSRAYVLLDYFGRADAKDMLETDIARLRARLVREQVGGEKIP
jgi:hypothetical protein